MTNKERKVLVSLTNTIEFWLDEEFKAEDFKKHLTVWKNYLEDLLDEDNYRGKK